MGVVSIKELLEAGVHFGHQTNRWNPKMKKFLFGERNGIYIIDLQQTRRTDGTGLCLRPRHRRRRSNPSSLSAPSGKRRKSSRKKPVRANMFLREPALARRHADQLPDHPTQHRQNEKIGSACWPIPAQYGLKKKEILQMQKKSSSCRSILTGIKNMRGLPGAVFVLDTRIERIAVQEATRLEIPVIAIIDSNCDPDHITYPDSRQRRRDSLHQAHHLAHRRRLHRRRPFADATRRGRIPTDPAGKTKPRRHQPGGRARVITHAVS